MIPSFLGLLFGELFLATLTSAPVAVHRNRRRVFVHGITPPLTQAFVFGALLRVFAIPLALGWPPPGRFRPVSRRPKNVRMYDPVEQTPRVENTSHDRTNILGTVS